jgi:hypothetical protein
MLLVDTPREQEVRWVQFHAQLPDFTGQQRWWDQRDTASRRIAAKSASSQPRGGAAAAAVPVSNAQAFNSGCEFAVCLRFIAQQSDTGDRVRPLSVSKTCAASSILTIGNMLAATTPARLSGLGRYQ